MQYMLLIHTDETPFATMTPEVQAKMSEPYAAYNRALEQAGALLAGERLAPSATATTVKLRNEKRRCSTVPSPTPRNSSPASTSSRPPISTAR